MPNGNRFAGPEWVTAQTFELLAKGGIRKGTCECELPLRESRVRKRGHVFRSNRFAGARRALFPNFGFGRPVMNQTETLMAKASRLSAAETRTLIELLEKVRASARSL